jgi:hypothetical protein
MKGSRTCIRGIVNLRYFRSGIINKCVMEGGG